MIRKEKRLIGRLIRRGRVSGKIGMSEVLCAHLRIKAKTLKTHGWNYGSNPISRVLYKAGLEAE